MALTAGRFSGQALDSCPGFPQLKQGRSAFSRRGCLHSVALWPFLTQFTHVISARPLGGTSRRAGPLGAVRRGLQVIGQNVPMRLGCRQACSPELA